MGRAAGVGAEYAMGVGKLMARGPPLVVVIPVTTADPDDPVELTGE